MEQKSRSSRAHAWDPKQNTTNKGALAAGREPEEQKSRSSKSREAKSRKARAEEQQQKTKNSTAEQQNTSTENKLAKVKGRRKSKRAYE